MKIRNHTRLVCAALCLALCLTATPALAFGPIGDTALWQAPLSWFHGGVSEVAETLARWFGLADQDEASATPEAGLLLTKEGVNTDPNGCTAPTLCG